MTGAIRIDAAWCGRNPLPVHESGTDKNARGRVVLVGGARFVPGALRLTGEAALRAGAGKLQMATVEAVATSLGVLVPEAAMIALPMREDGEIAPAAIDELREVAPRCDIMIVGPGMSATPETEELVEAIIGLDPPALLLDAAALTGAKTLSDALAHYRGALVLTPHHGEMAAYTGQRIDDISADPAAAATRLAARLGGIIVLKGGETWIASPNGALHHYDGGCPGLATGGSGDVLAGIIGGLLARGANPVDAACWGTWLHGEAGVQAAAAIGPVGFMARDLLSLIPGLMAA